MSLTITGKVIEDENLGLTTLAADSDATDADNNVILSSFQSSISTSSSLGAELKSLGIYPDTTTNSANGTTQAIGIAENAIVSTTDQNLQFTNSTGGTLSAVSTGFTALDDNEIFLYSDSSNPDIVLGIEGNGTTANPSGAVAFALLLQPTSGGATIWVVQYEALTNTNPAVGEDANTLDLTNKVYVSGTSSTTSTESFVIGTKQPGQNYWLPFTSTDGKATVIVTGLDKSASSPDTVNTSSVGDGSDSQAITPTQALRFDFVSSFTGGSTKDKTFLTDGSLNSLVYTEGNEATFDISQVTPTGSFVNVLIIAQNETNGTFGSTNTSTSTNPVTIGEVKVWTGGVGGNLIADSAQASNLNHGITFTFNADGSVTVNHLTVNETVDFIAANGAQFDQFVAKNVTGTGNTPGFDILNVTQTQTTTTTITDTQEVGSHIIFEDSVPTASTSKVTGTVDEDQLSTNLLPDKDGSATATGSVTTLFNPGVDTPLTYRLATDTSSLTSQGLTSGGNALNYAVTSSGGVDTLTASYTVGLTTTTVFTLALTEATGAWTFTLSAPVDQGPGANDSSNTTIDFSSLILATDADGNFGAGDTATAGAGALTVTVIDDVPVNFNPEAIVAADDVQDAAGSTFTGKLVNTDSADGTVDPNSSLTIDQHAGADGFGALTFTGTNGSKLTGQLDGGSSQNLQANGSDIYLFGFGTGTLTATTDSTGAGLPGGASGSPITADEVFTITLDHTSGQYTFDMLQPIGNGARFTFSDFADVPAGDYAWFSLPFNPTTKEPVSPGKSVVFTGLSPGVDTVNPSNIGVGTDKQAVAPGEAIRIDFVDNVHSITTTTDLKSLSTLGYLDHYEVNNSGFTLSQVNPNGKTVDIRLDAYEVPESTSLSPGGTFPSDATHEAITEVKIVTEDSSGNVTGTLADFTADGTATFTNGGVSQSVIADFAPTGDSNGVDLQGLKQVPGEFILVSTATGFDRLLATNIGTVYSNKDSFDMGAVSVSTFNAGQPLNMSFNLALQDYDAFHSGSNSNLTEAGTGTLNINLTAPTHA